VNTPYMKHMRNDSMLSICCCRFLNTSSSCFNAGPGQYRRRGKAGKIWKMPMVVVEYGKIIQQPWRIMLESLLLWATAINCHKPSIWVHMGMVYYSGWW